MSFFSFPIFLLACVTILMICYARAYFRELDHAERLQKDISRLYADRSDALQQLAKETADNTTAKQGETSALNLAKSLQLTIDQHRVEASKSDFAIRQLKAEQVIFQRRIETYENRLKALQLPITVLPTSDWSEQDEAQFLNLLKCDIGAKFMRHMETMEQATNRNATASTEPVGSAGEARGFRGALYEIKRLCGTPQPNTGENTSDTEKSPSESAEQFRA